MALSLPDVAPYRAHTPVLSDDIISTARTMIEAVKHLQNTLMHSPVCVGVHGIFANDAFAELKKAGASLIATSNSISHSSNKIDLSPLIVESLRKR